MRLLEVCNRGGDTGDMNFEKLSRDDGGSDDPTSIIQLRSSSQSADFGLVNLQWL